MNGRMETETKLRHNIESKLAKLPPIFTAFYNYMEADQKSYLTIRNYIDWVAEFRDAVGKNQGNDWYANVTVPQLREYIVSLRRRIENGKEIKNSDSTQTKKWSALNTFFNFLINPI